MLGDSGWTVAVRKGNAAYGAGSNLWVLDGRRSGEIGFHTRPRPPSTSTEQPEEYYYSLEVAPFNSADDVDQLGPFMPPVVDDVTIYYMPYGAARVLLEQEVIGS